MMTFPILLAALASSSAHHAPINGDQAFLALLAETKTMRMAGMPAMPEMPDIDMSKLPPGVKLPNFAGMGMMSGKPTRVLNVRLWTPLIAPEDAFATITPPSGLKQGDKLNLALYRPTSESGNTGGPRQFNPDSNPDFTIKIYWGSSKTVREGQPKIFKWTGLTADQRTAMKEKAQRAQSANSYFYKDGWTTGYWPTSSEPGQIGNDASLVGKYTLNTNYSGNVEIEAPSNVDFLAGIKMNTPDLTHKTDFNGYLPFSWDGIPNVLGQFASIIGMEGRNTMILWTSSEDYSPGIMGDMGFLQMSEVKDYVSQKVFMPGDQTSADVPAGIFANADFTMFNMVGYGPGAALDKAQPLPRIQTKTTMQIMLGGKKMNMDRRGGGDEKK